MKREEELVFETIFANKLDDIAEYIQAEANLNISRHGNWDTGFLAQHVIIEKPNKETRIVRWTAPYGFSVEYGSEPHMPPVDAIERWVIRKLGKKGKEAKSMAWAISYSIKAHGTEAHPFLRPAIQAAKAKYG